MWLVLAAALVIVIVLIVCSHGVPGKTLAIGIGLGVLVGLVGFLFVGMLGGLFTEGGYAILSCVYLCIVAVACTAVILNRIGKG
jgi:hypothetical protein